VGIFTISCTEGPCRYVVQWVIEKRGTHLIFCLSFTSYHVAFCFYLR